MNYKDSLFFRLVCLSFCASWLIEPTFAGDSVSPDSVQNFSHAFLGGEKFSGPFAQNVIEAQRIVKKWKKQALHYVEQGQNMDELYIELSQDKYKLKQWISDPKILDPYTKRQAENTIDLLRLLQLQTIIKAVDIYKATFNVSLKIAAKGRLASPPTTFPAEWFRIRRNRAAILLNRFQNLLNAFPLLQVQPPRELLGKELLVTFKQGIQAYEVLNQYHTCFQSRQEDCSALSPNI